MKNADKLRNFMRPGRVYRRQELEAVSTAVDRDLRTLVDNGDARKLAGGLYCRTRMNPFDVTPPEEKELVRAFLKSGDFLLAPYDHFNQLGLGRTQRHDSHVVYNHKRSGDFLLGGQRFRFRVVRAYPKSLSAEYLLVDLLNHARTFPGETARIIASLKSRLNAFDREKLETCLERYGGLEARKILRGLLEKRERMPLRVVTKEYPRGDLGYWLGKPPAERVAAVEFLREQYYALSGYKSLPRLARAIQLRSGQE